MKTVTNLFFYRFSILAALVSVAPFSTRAAGVVTSPTEASLRAALAGGGAVTFATSGTITLSAVLAITNSTSIDGAGYSVTLSGNHVTGVFLVDSNVQFTLNDLTVANGFTNAGAGLYNAGGTVTISNVLFTGNQALGTNGVTPGMYSPSQAGQSVSGGAIYNAGSLELLACQFLTNSITGGIGGAGYIDTGGSGGSGYGGAICNAGPLMLLGCQFISNSITGGMGGRGLSGFFQFGGTGGQASGGAIYSTAPVSDFY